MFPLLGPLRTYIPLYVLGMLSHIYFAQRWCHKLALPRRTGLWLSAFYVFGMAVGARILYDLVEHQFDIRNYVRLGYYFGDGLWGGPLAYLMLAAPLAILCRRRRDVLDLMVLSLPLPMVLAKLACLLNGCCYGVPCDWPWCLTFPPGADAPPGIARHPTQAYEIIVMLVIWFVLVTLQRRGAWTGSLTLWFVFLYGMGRPLAELFRAPDPRRPSLGMLTTSQAVCLVAAWLALVGLWLFRPRPDRPGLHGASSLDAKPLWSSKNSPNT